VPVLSARSLVRSFLDVFPYPTLWTTELHETLLVGSLSPMPGSPVQKGKVEQLKVVMIFGQGTGPYKVGVGASGTATLQLVQSRPKPAEVEPESNEDIWAADAVEDIYLLIASGKTSFDQEALDVFAGG
jgi:hypothetical protein